MVKALWIDDGTGMVPNPELTPEEFQAALIEHMKHEYQGAVQVRLDQVAQTRGYDSILSLCSYATSTNAQFAAEAAAGVAWRDAVWAKGYEILAAVQSGLMAAPSLEEFLGQLPAITWPPAVNPEV